jgi:beta-lactam-binding protein with PASTA domain
MNLKEFLLSKMFHKNLAIAMVIAVGLVILLLIWLNIFTRHGQAIQVPDFYGKTIEETALLAQKHKLRYQIIDSVYTTLVSRGCIAEQNPKPGFKVKKKRRVVLTVNAFNPEMVAVPNLIGLPRRQALKVIESSGFEPGELRYKPDLSEDYVLNQLHNGKEVAAGDSLQKGSVIDLTLGKGLSNIRTPVPDLLGMGLEEARDKILGSSLNLGSFIYDNSIISAKDTLEAFVFKQNPEFQDEATLQLGAAVYIWLTTDTTKLPSDPTLPVLPDSIPGTAGVNRIIN